MRRAITTATVVLLAGIGLRPACEALGRPAARSVRIGVIRTLAPGMPTALLAMAMRPMKAFMEEQTGLAGEVVRGGDACELAKQLAEGEVQVAIFHGHEFAWARTRYPGLRPIVICISQHRSLKALLVVPEKSPASGYADLRGKPVGLPGDSRAHCRVYLERNCVQPGIPVKKFYRLARPADSVEALDEIVVGRLHGAIIDEGALERYRQAHPGRARKLRVLQESDPFPPGVIAYHEGQLAPESVKQVRDAMLAAKDHPKGRQTLNLLRMARFEPASEEYELSLRAIARIYPAPE